VTGGFLRRNLGFLVAAILIIVAAGLVALAARTPWYTDAKAYSDGLSRISEHAVVSADNAHAATRAFFKLQDTYATRKWVYADLGYSLASMGATLLVLAGLARVLGGWPKLFRSQRSPWLIATLATFSLAGVTVAQLASVLHAVYRMQLPIWADSIGIPLFSILGFMTVTSPVVLLLCLWPLALRGRDTVSLTTLRSAGDIGNIASSVVYGGLALACLLMAAFSYEAGGWALLPASLILAWLFLNARALIIAPKSARP